MTTTRPWTPAELDAIGNATELHLASHRADDSQRPYVTMWVVRVGDELFVRSGYGRENPWFVRAHTRMTGSIRAGGLERAVAFEDCGSEIDAAVTAEYHTKYDHFGSSNVSPMVTPLATAATLRLIAVVSPST